MSLTDESLIIYTDGGCLQAANLGGWGIHGYFYSEDVPKQGAGCSKGVPTAKGYCSKEDNKAKPEPLVTLFRYIDGFGSIPKDCTNNIAELTAAIEAFRFILEKKPKKVTLFTDSNYVVKGLNEWHHNWLKSDWIKADGTTVSNRELWEELISLNNRIIEAGIEVTVQWVKGHNGDVGNEIADVFARYGIILSKKKMEFKEIKETESKGYWGKSYEYNRIIDKPRWYFNSFGEAFYNEDMSRKPNGKWIYHLGNHGPDDEDYCKPIADSCFSVVYLKDKIEELEMVRKYQNQLNNRNFENVVIGKLDKILSADMLEMLNIYKTLLFSNHVPQKDIVLDKALLTKVMDPPQLAYKGANILNHLEWVLDGFLEDPKKYKLCVTDITDIFYGIESKGKKEVCKLKASIGSATKKVNAKVSYDTDINNGEIEVPLLLGIDTPSRNALAALAEANPRFYVVTWKDSENAFKYATILKTDDDIGIWAGVYSNLRLLSS